METEEKSIAIKVKELADKHNLSKKQEKEWLDLALEVYIKGTALLGKVLKCEEKK